ncbi:MAG: DUF1801 domain-containing protein [Acholeplasmataceae bacterium]|nr:DUF1801 domain-containing protein [Acholeplasmataceae bacterium]
MKTFEDFLNTIDLVEHQMKLKEILDWIKITYPNLKERIAWNQPMFTDHDTFIIAFSVSKKHIAIAPEKVAIDKFLKDIEASGYETSTMLFRIKWKDTVDYNLLKKIIDFNIESKKEHTKFWR